MLELLASTHDATQTAAEDKEGRSRCVHSRPGALAVVCWPC
jgi:hypothetical protein